MSALIGRVGRRSRFARVLTLIFVLALTWRIIFVSIWGLDPLPFGDGLQYHFAGIVLANGGGFANSMLFSFGGGVRASAQHPPMYSLMLAAVTRVGRALGLGSFDSTLVHQIASAVFSSVGVVVIGFLGRRVGGARVGLLAAALAAVYPALWVRDAQVMSESLDVLTTAFFLLAVVAYIERPGALPVSLIGVAAGIAMLTRAEAAFLLLAVAVGAIVIPHTVSRGLRIRHLLFAGLIASVVVAPWVVRNLTTFDRPIFLSENVDSVIGGANCRSTYYGSRIGAWDENCNTADLPKGDESEVGAELRHRGVQYALRHVSHLPLVAAARVGRLLSVYHPLDDDWGGPRWALWADLVMFATLHVAAIAGACRLRRRRGPLWLFVVVFATTVAIAALNYGSTRFRIEWDVALVVLAAVGIERHPSADSESMAAPAPELRAS